MTVAHPPAIRSIFHERTAYWRRLAACRTTPTEVFFPPKGHTADAARAICSQCPVIASCRSFALDTHQTEGVWAGLVDKDLRRLRREMRAAS